MYQSILGFALVLFFFNSLKVQDHTFTEYAPGKKGSPYETKFTINLNKKGNKIYTIKEVWVNGRKASFTIQNQGKEKLIEISGKGSYSIVGKTVYGGKIKKNTESGNVSPPTKDELIIVYVDHKGNKKIITQEKINLQSIKKV